MPQHYSDRRESPSKYNMPTLNDIRFIVRECGSELAALNYCNRLAARKGPLTAWYAAAAQALRQHCPNRED